MPQSIFSFNSYFANELTPLFSKEGQGDILAEDKTKLIREINIVIKSPLTPLF